MMIGLISIYKGDFLEVKIEISLYIIGMITKSIFKSSLLYIVVELRTTLEKVAIKDILIIYADKKV